MDGHPAGLLGTWTVLIVIITCLPDSISLTEKRTPGHRGAFLSSSWTYPHSSWPVLDVLTLLRSSKAQNPVSGRAAHRASCTPVWHKGVAWPGCALTQRWTEDSLQTGVNLTFRQVTAGHRGETPLLPLLEGQKSTGLSSRLMWPCFGVPGRGAAQRRGQAAGPWPSWLGPRAPGQPLVSWAGCLGLVLPTSVQAGAGAITDAAP